MTTPLLLVLLTATLVLRRADAQDLSQHRLLETRACAELNQKVVEQAAAGKWKEAEAALSTALARDASEPEAACAGVALTNLAAVMCRSGRFAEAEGIAERSVNILADIQGSEHPLLRSLQILSTARFEQGKLRMARKAFQRMQSIGAEHPEDRALVHGAAAFVFQREGRLVEAELEYRKVLAELDKAGRGNVADAGSVLNSLGSIYIQQGRLDDAARALDRALPIFAAATDSEPPDRIMLLNIRAALHTRQHEWQKAQQDLQDAISIADHETQLDPAYLGMLLGRYAQVLRKNHQGREARSVEARAASLPGRGATSALVDVTELSAKLKALK
jgi:tetratricopeptide (TPR) repeat protein